MKARRLNLLAKHQMLRIMAVFIALQESQAVLQDISI